MTEAEVKAVIREVLSEQRQNEPSLDAVAMKTMANILNSFGIEEDDRVELKADLSHLRRWRKSVEQAQSYTFKAVITIIATGIVGAFWMGFKSLLGK